MKFQLKALVAALALVAAVPASAAINPASSGNSSFVLSVWDAANNISASFDLGVDYSQFSIAANATQTASTPWANSGITTPGTSMSWDLTSGDYASAWTSFAAAANEAGASWVVTAADNLGTGAGSRGYITTYTGAPFAAFNTNGLVAAVGQFNLYTDNLGTNESLAQNHTTTLNGANTAVNGKLSYAPYYYFGGRNLGTGPMSIGTVGSSLGIVQTVTGSNAVSQVTNTIFPNTTFKLTSDGLLTVTAVPEPETYAMLLAGLGFMGFVARRKQAK